MKIKKTNKKNVSYYLAKTSFFVILIIILLATLFSCSLKWQPILWPSKYCPATITITPNNPLIRSILLNKINCTNKNKDGYELIISHNTTIENPVLSAQTPAKIRSYSLSITASLLKKGKSVIKPINIQSNSQQYTSLVRPITQDLDYNSLIDDINSLLNKLIINLNSMN